MVPIVDLMKDTLQKGSGSFVVASMTFPFTFVVWAKDMVGVRSSMKTRAKNVEILFCISSFFLMKTKVTTIVMMGKQLSVNRA